MTRHVFKAFLALATLCLFSTSVRADHMPNATLGASLSKADAAEQSIVLAGGCFWGVEAVFEHLRGVTNVVSGYAGGEEKTAHYGEVSSGTTGHAEAVKITFDPAKVSLGQILKVYFFIAHNPTQLNYQGPDHGTQYRSDLFYTTAEQKDVAGAYIKQLDAAKVFPAPIVTRIDELKAFYAAEDYHQDFMKKNPLHPYILFHDAPKVTALKKEMPTLYRD